jgi:hypothetical protein
MQLMVANATIADLRNQLEPAPEETAEPAPEEPG